jgi:glycine/D-amino acid oxidase-like deaminating enzyme
MRRTDDFGLDGRIGGTLGLLAGIGLLAIPGLGPFTGFIGISKDFAPVVGSHPRYSSVHYAAGAAGLPWAAALGRYLAEKALDGRNDVDAVLAVHRRFPIGPHLQAVFGRRLPLQSPTAS